MTDTNEIMKIPPLKLSALSIVLSFIAQSCTGPTYVESTPPPPDYSQAPPPSPQQPGYSDQGYDGSQDAPPPVSYQSFYNELSPYGQWISTPDYGYVWVPAAGPDFQPYATSGHWVYTNYGWTWASDYSWGWAPFHYGTWDFDGTIGWFWIPGYQWSPAWVSWRSEPGYYGWAPLGPSYANAGYANYYCPPERYVFVSATYINSPSLSTYYVPRGQNATYYGRSAVITNTYYDRGSNSTYYTGPQSAEVERYTGSPVRQVTVVQTSSPDRTGVSGNQITMFRPAVRQPGSGDIAKPAPQTIYQRNNLTPVSQRQVLTHPNQPRATPFQQENNQRPNQEQNKQPQPQQRPNPQEQQHPVNQQQAPASQQYHAPVQQKQPQPRPYTQVQQRVVAPQPVPANPQQHAMVQPQQPQQKPVQQQPAQQGRGRQQMSKQKQAKPQKPQPQPQKQQDR